MGKFRKKRELNFHIQFFIDSQMSVCYVKYVGAVGGTAPFYLFQENTVMLIAIFGESCTGKSTLASALKTKLDAQIYTGKDYLRLAKNEAIARKLFQDALSQAVNGAHILYVISEKAHLALLPDGCIRILATAELDAIKQRFANRMHGVLPAPVAAMLERNHGCFDAEPHHIHYVSGNTTAEDVFQALQL